MVSLLWKRKRSSTHTLRVQNPSAKKRRAKYLDHVAHNSLQSPPILFSTTTAAVCNFEIAHQRHRGWPTLGTTTKALCTNIRVEPAATPTKKKEEQRWPCWPTDKVVTQEKLVRGKSPSFAGRELEVLTPGEYTTLNRDERRPV